MNNMTNVTMHGMMNGSMMHGMGWAGLGWAGLGWAGLGWGMMVLCAVFGLLFFAILVLMIMSLLKYLRKPD